MQRTILLHKLAPSSTACGQSSIGISPFSTSAAHWSRLSRGQRSSTGAQPGQDSGQDWSASRSGEDGHSSSSFPDPPPRQGLDPVTRRAMLERIIRVDHAGELGADRIYAGQYFVLGKSKSGSLVKHMWDQEKEHLRRFERLIAKHRIRPTALSPLWNVAGFMLGASTAALGKEAAMACTVAVEESITEHYNNQIRELIEDDPEAHKDLLEIITKCRDEEMEHHDTGLENDAEKGSRERDENPVRRAVIKRRIGSSDKAQGLAPGKKAGREEEEKHQVGDNDAV